MTKGNHNEPSDDSLKVLSSASTKAGGNLCLKAAKHATKPAHCLCRTSLPSRHVVWPGLTQANENKCFLRTKYKLIPDEFHLEIE